VPVLISQQASQVALFHISVFCCWKTYVVCGLLLCFGTYVWFVWRVFFLCLAVLVVCCVTYTFIVFRAVSCVMWGVLSFIVRTVSCETCCAYVFLYLFLLISHTKKCYNVNNVNFIMYHFTGDNRNLCLKYKMLLLHA
jgi:hypothetical protein